jgi:signal transduction histidine kinase
LTQETAKHKNAPKLIEILLIEDNPGDARLIKEYLSEVKNITFNFQVSERLIQGIEIVESENIDLVLLDLKLPDSEGLDTFRRIFAAAPHVPIIVLSGLNDETTAIKAVQMGAQDYLVKDKVESNLLIRSIRYAIERKRAEEEHQSLLEQRIRSLSIIEAQENERRRISRELHDGLGQLLSATKLKLGMFEFVQSQNKEKFNELIKEVDSIISKAIVEARRISHDLRPTTLDDFGLIPALRILCQEFSKLTGVKVKFQVSQLLERIDPKVEIAIYRIIQESFNNISKYAESTEVVLDLYRKDNFVYVRVKDNGKGFDMKEAAKNKKMGTGFGLLNMKERAELVGGKVDIFSSVGQGTEVLLEINLNFFHNQ